MPGLIAHLFAVVALFTALPAAAQAAAPPLLHPLFQDHGVLQRDRPIAVWGHAAPGQSVHVTLAGNRADATADKTGIWRATLPALAAGGPYTLTAAAPDRTQTVSDVLIGDVWLCSGQSNMEMAVSGALNPQVEINNANDPQTRILSIQHDIANAPQTDFIRPVEWKLVSPQSIGDFSAACWFMARELRKSQNVPFGLIDASWGGTAINAWRPESSMAGDPSVRESLDLLALARIDPPRAAARWGTMWGTWWRSKNVGAEPWGPDAPGDWKPVPAITYWEQWGVPELANYNGLLFYRTEITLTAAQAKQGATLNLGVVDDVDMSFINGTGVGSMSSWDVARSYRLAKGVLKPGVNRITVAAFDSWGPGGMAGTAEQRKISFDDGTSLALPEAAKWQYRIAPGMEPPHAPWESASGIAGIYNGMIAPLGNYGLRGVAWYQGESDAGTPEPYAAKLGSMMGAWRGQFGNGELPFLIVQLPDWGARVTAPAESGFASIRDQQRRAVAADKHAALVVTIDVGDPINLHPENKQAVGHRLARAAGILAYGAPGSPSGPQPKVEVSGDHMTTLSFTGVGGELLTYSGSQVLGFELCGPAPGTCRFTAATVKGNLVGVQHDFQPFTRIRYCWGESPVCNLYDKTGLPVTPFEIKVE
ncbi:9-O-acetylesterase [Sphingomonas sp. LB-2]|uniref:sialate O-acetylesterase n=1 Tax=Sphingomonas caeni TaxID=2984949 RepID=UPI00222F0476|nr:sialate O-acetylesterase [Sphingomonas caeni]MCW3849340.1 9-O-acetylesterase [Sphingomonas caeni]